MIKVPKEFKAFKMGAWVKEIEPSFGHRAERTYMVSKEPHLSPGGYWVLYVATSLNKRALNHYRRCDDFELCEKPIKGVNLFLTREQAEWLLDRVDIEPGGKILLPEVAQGVVNKLKEKLSK